MPEVEDCIRGDMLLPSRGEMLRGYVMACSNYASGNEMDRAHTNLILNTKMYQVELIGGDFLHRSADELMGQTSNL